MKRQAFAVVCTFAMLVLFAGCSGMTGTEGDGSANNENFTLRVSANGSNFKAVRTGGADPVVQILDANNNVLQEANGTLVQDGKDFTLTVVVGSMSLVITGTLDDSGNITNLGLKINGATSGVSTCEFATLTGSGSGTTSGGSSTVSSGSSSSTAVPADISSTSTLSKQAVTTSGSGYVSKGCSSSVSSTGVSGPSGTVAGDNSGGEPCTGYNRVLPDRFSENAGGWCLDSAAEKIFSRIFLSKNQDASYVVYDSGMNFGNTQSSLAMNYCAEQGDISFFADKPDSKCHAGWHMSFIDADSMNVLCGDNRYSHTFKRCPIAVE